MYTPATISGTANFTMIIPEIEGNNESVLIIYIIVIIYIVVIAFAVLVLSTYVTWLNGNFNHAIENMCHVCDTWKPI